MKEVLPNLNKTILILASLASSCLTAKAQDDDFKAQFDAFTQSAEQRYDSFRQRSNAEFADFLKKAWQNFEAVPEVKIPKEDPLPPIKYDDKKPIIQNELPIEEVVPAPKPQDEPKPVEPVVFTPVKKENWHEFPLYGTSLKVRIDESLKFSLLSTDERHVSDAWRGFGGVYFDNLLSDCLEIKKNRRLCDWAYLTMLSDFASSFLGSQNEATLLTAALYSNSGYSTKLGRTGNGELRMLYGCDNIIFGKSYYCLDRTNYYVLGNKNEPSLNIAYGFSFPGEKPMRLTLDEEPLLDRVESAPRTLKSLKYPVSETCSVNKTLMDFFSTYPSSEYGNNFMTRWAIYANTPIDEDTKKQLYPGLEKAIEGKSPSEATDLLLNFVQTAFTYEYDDVVWGEDRAFFSEETLYYPYCDCEDRSILFSRLVRDLLSLDVILVYYPGHLATAVKIGEDIKGDYFQLKSGKYYVCDPTYVGAPIGKTMKDMDNSSATVILLK